MKKNKIFGIGMALIMVLVAIIPATNGLKAIKEENTDEKNIITNSDGWDLKAFIEDCEYVGPTVVNGKECAIWEVKYKVKNIGTGSLPYIGYIDGKIRVKDKLWTIAIWEKADGKLYTIAKGEKIGPITTRITISAEDEKYLANEYVDVYVGLKNEVNDLDPNEANNIGSIFGRFWKENNYKPTNLHLKLALSTEKWINSYTWDGPSLPVFNNRYIGEVLRSLIRSERMGWIGELLDDHISQIILDVISIIETGGAFVAATTAEITVIVNWIREIVFYVTSIANGAPIPGKLRDIVNDFVTLVLPAVALLIKTVDLYENKIQEKVNTLDQDIQCMDTFLASNPWLKPVTLDLTIINVKEDEEIKIFVNGERIFKDEAGSSNTFRISPTVNYWKNDEDKAVKMHDCTIKVEAENHKDTYSIGIASHVFSKGTLHWTFKLKDQNSKQKDFSIWNRENFQFLKFLSRFDINLPFFKLF